MKRIITISREFGSGGRTIETDGKRQCKDKFALNHETLSQWNGAALLRPAHKQSNNYAPRFYFERVE